jgi:hypothetical protein
VDGASVTVESSVPPIVRVFTMLKERPGAIRWIGLFAFLALLSPTVINYSSYPLAWDESYYLNRIICANQAFYGFSLSRLSECLEHTHKGPIMELVNLPWGRAGGSEQGMGLAFVGLALFIWVLILVTYRICLQCAISPISLLLSAATIGLTPFLRANAGAMMTDTLLGWCVALALMLIPLEYSRPSKGFWPSFCRGLLWSLVINVGMLNKVTFVFFVGAIGMALLVIRADYSGEWPLRYAVLACIVGSLPAILVWRYYGLNFLRFAFMVAWGSTARMWSVPGLTAGGYLKRFVGQFGLGLIPLSMLLVLFVRGMVIENQRRLGPLLPIGILLIYLGIAARSQNRDPRFGIPVMIAMPVCLAWTSTKRKTPIPLAAAPVFAALLMVVALSAPMVRRPEIGPIRRARELLKTLNQEQASKGQPMKIVIATDGPAFNVDSFLLAKQIGWDTLKTVDVDTLVYDAVNKRTVEDGLKRIDAADYVVFLRPGLTPGADWQRVYAAGYRAYCQKIGILQDSNISPDLDVFKIPKAEVR